MAEYDGWHLGVILQRRRRALRITQSAMTAETGISEQRLSRIENGNGREATFREVFLITSALRISMLDAAFAAGLAKIGD